MQFVWDETKNKLNKQKHGIDFELAKRAFDDPNLLSWEDKFFDDYPEERWISLGSIDNLLIIVLVHTFRSIDDDEEEIIRIISARKATKKEKTIYLNSKK